MIDLNGYRNAMKHLPEGAAWAEVNAQEIECMQVTVTQGEVTRTTAHKQTALYVRAKAERTGVTYTQNRNESPEVVINQALENSRYGEGVSDDVLLRQLIERTGTPLNPVALEPLLTIGNRLTELAHRQDATVVRATADVRVDTRANAVLNTYGLDVDDGARVYAAKVSVVGECQGRQFNADAKVTAESLDDLPLEAAVRRATDGLRIQYAPRSFASALSPVVLDSSVVINILTTAWQLFSGLKVQSGASALAGKLGSRVGAEAVHMTDRATREACGYRFQRDNEGVAGSTNSLMQAGVITGLMHTQATAAHAGVAATGNSGRVALLTGSIPTELIPVPRILCIEPGTATLAELLENMGNGVYIAQSFDVFHSINIGSGDFSIPCRGAVVKDGHCQYNVTGMTIAGNVLDLFSQVMQVGSDLWIDEFLLKSYCIGAPSLRLARLQVNGKG